MPKLNFKAAVLVKNKTKLNFMNIQFNQPLKKGQVLVKLKYSGICGKQIDEIDGIGGHDKFIPHMLGHEGSGIVKETAKGVKKVKNGDKVVLHWIKGSGIQSETPKYFSKEKKINSGWITTFNEYAVVSENRLTKIKQSYSLKKAALFGCCATTSMSLVFNKLKVKSQDKILIAGIGGLGQVILQSLKNFNVSSISIIDINKKALKKGKEFGANNIFNFSKKRDLNKIKAKSFDKIIITTGNSQAINFCLPLLKHPGDFFVMGVPKKNSKISTNAWNLMHDQRILGCLGGGANPDKDINRFIKMDKDKKTDVGKIIYKTIQFKDINKGIEIFKNKSNTGRVIIKF